MPKKLVIEKYEGLGLSDYEILRRTIKDTNSKLDRIAKTYGTDSTIYKKNLANIQMILPRGEYSNRYLTTDKGVTHLSQKIKIDLPEGEYLKKAKLLTDKVETIGQVKNTVEKAVKEIYGIDTDVRKISKQQQNRLVTNIYKLKDGFDKIMKEFYEVSRYYGNDQAIGLKPDVLLPILESTGIAREYPELVQGMRSKMDNFESKDRKGWNIVTKRGEKKTYNDMNNLILLTEAMVKLIHALENDVDVYDRFIAGKRSLGI